MQDLDPQTQPTAPSAPVRVFFGRVLPERAAVSLTGIGDILAKAEGHDDLLVRIHVDSSGLVAETRGGASMPDATLKETIRGLVASLVDCLGFVRGCGYQVEVTSLGGERAAVYGVRMGDGDSDRDVVHAKSAKLISLLLSHSDGALIPLERALADYRRAILEASDTPFHAFRAVEALTYYFDRNPRRGMPKLRAALNIGEDWVTSNLEVPAGEIRHGKARSVEEAERLRGLACARAVIFRFVEFVQYGQVLSAPKFPELA